MINEKIQQAIQILQEKNIDMWLTFVRETSATPDPMLDLILGTHCVWPSAFIITSDGHKDAIVGSLDAQNIKDHADYNVIGYVASIQEELLKKLKQYDPQRIAINYSKSDVMADGLSHGMYVMLMEYLSGTEYARRLVSSEEVVAALRGRKSATEIQLIREAIRETLHIFDQVTKFLRPGLTEKDVAAFIKKEMQKTGLSPAWDEEQCPAVFTGPDSAGAHAGPTDRLIDPGHILNIDFGVRKSGYCSDLQRTWYILRKDETEAPQPVQEAFLTIRDSIREAAKFLQPDRQGWQVDAVARDYIAARGYDEFPHALGHQIGRNAHDGSALLCPRWDRYKDLPFFKVEAGQVYTLEPRLTLKGYGVVTMEEIVLVTETGCEFLSKPQDEIYCIEKRI
jgi:Xaa-Pro aminopeptidase